MFFSEVFVCLSVFSCLYICVINVVFKGSHFWLCCAFCIFHDPVYKLTFFTIQNWNRFIDFNLINCIHRVIHLHLSHLYASSAVTLFACLSAKVCRTECCTSWHGVSVSRHLYFARDYLFDAWNVSKERLECTSYLTVNTMYFHYRDELSSTSSELIGVYRAKYADTF